MAGNRKPGEFVTLVGRRRALTMKLTTGFHDSSSRWGRGRYGIAYLLRDRFHLLSEVSRTF